MPERPIAKKTVNALMPEARASFSARMFGGGVAEMTGRRLFGGLWVGGDACLYQDRLEFEPNAVNRLAHAGDCRWSLLLSDISTVKVRHGVVTNIIDLTTKNGVCSVRCHGAHAFADAIRAAAGIS